MSNELFDYSNLKNDAEEAKKNKGWRPYTEGVFPCAFLKAEKSKTQGHGGKKKRPQFILSWGVRKKADEFMHKKELKVRYILDIDFQRERFLTDMIEFGVDFERLTCDADWEEVFDELFEQRCKANIKVYYNDSDKNPDGTIKEKAWPELRVEDVIVGLPEDSDWAIEGGWVTLCDDVETPAPAEAEAEEPKKKAAKAQKPKPEPKPEPAEEEEAPETHEAPEQPDAWD